MRKAAESCRSSFNGECGPDANALDAKQEVPDSRPSFSDISDIQFSNRHSLRQVDVNVVRDIAKIYGDM